MYSKKAQLDEFNPVYILLAVLGGVIAYGVSGYGGSTGKGIQILSGLVTIVVVYFYLSWTGQ